MNARKILKIYSYLLEKMTNQKLNLLQKFIDFLIFVMSKINKKMDYFPPFFFALREYF